jgi:uncharacterized cupredoxin-like copper-binding protein
VTSVAKARVVVAAALVAATVAVGGYRVAGAPAAAEPAALGPGEVTVAVGVEHSRFVPADLRVVEGTRVRFIVDNRDPIHHELIVGPPEVHARHARGTEREHPSIPGEVSVGPGGLAVTTFTFDDVGTVELACHLPGHFAYGMHGTVEVVPARWRRRVTTAPLTPGAPPRRRLSSRRVRWPARP